MNGENVCKGEANDARCYMSITTETEPGSGDFVSRFINHRAYWRVLAGISVLHIFAFAVADRSQGNSIPLFLLAAVGRITWFILYAPCLDILMITLPLVIVGFQKRVDFRVMIAFLMFIGAHLLSAQTYFRHFVDHLHHSDVRYDSTAIFEVGIGKEYSLLSYVRFVVITAWQYLSMAIFDKSYPFRLEELEKYHPRINVAIVIALLGLLIMTIAGMIQKRRSPANIMGAHS